MCNCTNTTTACAESTCGCAFEVDAGCVRYSGESLSCIDVISGNLLSDVLTKINAKYCEVSSANYFNLQQEAPGPNCAYGGVRIDLVNGDTNLIMTTQYVCTGATGANGLNGNTILSGNVAPEIYNGSNGDYYIDNVTHILYGPKVSGVWGSGISLIGPAGAPGVNGTNGTNGIDGVPGGWSSKWIFQAGTSATPLPTNLNFDNSVPGFATKVYINFNNNVNIDMVDFLAAFSNNIGGTNYYGLLKIYNANSDETNFWMGKITGYSTVGLVAHIDVTVIQNEGSFLSGDILVVDFTPNGATGATGPSVDFRPYKVYSALISQSGTAAPTATVLENTIGAIVWTRTSAGTYSGTLTGAFTASKTFSQLTLSLTDPQVIGYTKRNSGDVVAIRTYDPSTIGRDSTLDNASLEIRVYN